MKGHVPTPVRVVDRMVEKLFSKRAPERSDTLVDPGCGDGVFIDGVLRWCRQHKAPIPRILGVELNPRLVEQARRRFANEPRVEILHQDYLKRETPAEFVIGNPPYVSILSLSDSERATYRALFETAVGRFDLYILFFERSLKNLQPDGRLCLITPEKFEYVETAEPLRRLMTKFQVEELDHAHEETFEGFVTYPLITTVANKRSRARTTVSARDGRVSKVALPNDGASWNGTLNGAPHHEHTLTLEDVALRISPGVATGADEIYVIDANELPSALAAIAHPTVSGRQLGLLLEGAKVSCRERMLVPYNRKGQLLDEKHLGVALRYFARPDIKRKLEARTCVTRGGKKYYSFHDSAPLQQMLRPKILCKDIGAEPRFWLDERGDIVPRHSVYYIVPHEEVNLQALYEYLCSDEAKTWIKAHAQRAAKGFYRLQSTVLKRLPVPSDIGSSTQKRVIGVRT